MVSSDGKYAYLLPINIKNDKINDVFYRALYIDTIRRNPNTDFIVSENTSPTRAKTYFSPDAGRTSTSWVEANTSHISFQVSQFFMKFT